MEYSCKPCRCGSGFDHHPLFDCHGIFCDYVCGACEHETRAKYRPETFSGYTQADIDEPIEEDVWFPEIEESYER